MNATYGPIGKLSPQPWLRAPETLAVLDALTAKGAEVRFVGGCVRDALANRPPSAFETGAVSGDIDLATPDPPETVMTLLQAAGIKAIPTGIAHGTITAIVGDQKFEITTLRRDVETDGRRATVAFTDDWIADASRRDLTINALSATPDGDIYDHYEGINDLAHGRIRFVGIAAERITEDVLRLLRFFRFYGLFGRPQPDRDAIAACRAHANKLPGLSGERVRDELFKILLVPDPAELAVMMRGLGVFDHILMEAGDVGRLRMTAWLETRAIKVATVAPDSLRRVAALINTDAAGAEALAARLRLSNRQTLRLVTLAAPPVAITPEMGGPDIRRALHRLGPEVVRDLTLLAWAGELAITPRLPSARTQGWLDLLQQCDDWQGAPFPLTGEDAIGLGVEEGPRIGQAMAKVEDWWEAGDFKADRDACLEQLKLLFAGE
ncbi:MAG: CCA tRNA nucleotidyltransferase [Proteobacteria bacterium]|nr:CCA tRNA nucleotidyltransferase [Pseudomonadota bacterium]